MAKFLNKKEQVIDFKLTSYGHYLLSNGKFKPEYYGFYDDNVVYDGRYVGRTEGQNYIRDRIKDKTSYIESLVLFEELEKSPNTVIEKDTGDVYFTVDVVPTYLKPRKDVFRFESMIGDAYLEGDTQNAPAWKASLLEGQISSSAAKDIKNDVLIPQINIDANYRLKIDNSTGIETLTNTSTEIAETQTAYFSDNKRIILEQDNIMLYLEEINTTLLTENFDIEIYEVGVDAVDATHTDVSKTDSLTKKVFLKEAMALKGAEITQEYFDDGNSMVDVDYNTNQVEYYFDLYRDANVNQAAACRGLEIFNKDSYYIDLDFECEKDEYENVYYDIYGPVTEPEIC